MNAIISPARHQAITAAIESLMKEWYAKQSMPETRTARARAIADMLEARGMLR